MNNFTEISPFELNDNTFKLISKDWTLITAGNITDDGNTHGYNTMTASWGGLGVLWNKNVATIYVRPQRYTYEFIEENEYFTLSFFDESKRSALAFCGKNSGRDCDKAKECRLTPIAVDDSVAGNPVAGNPVAFDEAQLILVCKKLYHSDIDPKNFYSAEIETHYNNDYHRMYIGEIVKILIK